MQIFHFPYFSSHIKGMEKKKFSKYIQLNAPDYSNFDPQKTQASVLYGAN